MTKRHKVCQVKLSNFSLDFVIHFDNKVDMGIQIRDLTDINDRNFNFTEGKNYLFKTDKLVLKKSKIELIRL